MLVDVPPSPPHRAAPAVRPAAVVVGALGGVSSRDARRVLARRPGGLVLFGELADGGRALRIALRHSHARPVLMIDQEGGIVRRVRTLGPVPARRLRRLPAGATQREYRAAGRGLRALGVHVDLAPVADVDAGGVTAARALGGTPGSAGARVAAALRGLHQAGVAGCVKHFPGLGTVPVNTDHGVAIDRRSRHAIVRDLSAYRHAIRAGARCVMVSSVVVPSLCARPALLCPATYRRLRRMGFRGAIVTDSLDARALRPYGSPGELAVLALAAGADGVLVTSPASTLATIDEVARALRRGRLSPARLRGAARRLEALRTRRGVTQVRAPGGSRPTRPAA